ncbi:MAG: CHAT domain-containing protein [Cyanobacteria bacterium J06559_1]
MKASKLIVIQLGSGTLAEGFPLVTAQLWARKESLPEQFTGALLPAPHLQQLNQSWQAMYRALCDRTVDGLRSQPAIHSPTHSSEDIHIEDDDDELEIEADGVQHVSTYDFETLCHTLSEAFNQWLCTSDFGTIERPLRSHLSLQDDIRIILTTQDESVRRLPWQRWHLLQDFSGAELALSLPQYRRSQQQATPATRQQSRILAILGNAQGIDLAQEQQFLHQLPGCEVKFLTQPSRQQFDSSLWDTRGWDLLFFAGHSSSDSGSKGQLYINEQAHNSLTIDELSEALSAAIENGLQLAIFNSCDGLGLASQLAHLNIPQVIVMREPVPNRVAQHFFQSFLTAYVQQALPLYATVKRSRRQLQALEDDFPGATWLPILCQNPAEEPCAWQDLSKPEPALATGTAEAVTEEKISRQAYRDRQIFLNKVRSAWIEGVLNKSLLNKILVNTHLSELPHALQTPAAVEVAPPTGYPLPPGTRLATYFEKLGLGRTLLLLGAPGAGKTIALLELAQTMLQRAEANAQAPMPVVLNLASWNSTQTRPSKKSRPNNKLAPSIYPWLLNSLYSYYQVPKSQVESWLHSGQLTLLLDGLDEVAPTHFANCIQAINQFHQDYNSVEMVICCRQRPYLSSCDTTNQFLALQAALVIQPLSLAQIEDYCTSLGSIGKTLWLALGEDRQLSEIAASPLMLNIIALSIEEGSLSHSNNDLAPNTRRYQLLNAYINRMMLRRPKHNNDNVTLRKNNNPPTAAETISGLRYLAQQMEQSSQSIFQLEAIQPTWLEATDRQLWYPLILGVVLASVLSIFPTLAGLWLGGPLVALSLFISWALVGGSISGYVGGWLGGATGGLIGGVLSTILVWLIVPRFSIGLLATPILAILMGFVFAACKDVIVPVEGFRWSWQKASRRLVIGLGVGSLLGIPLWLTGSIEWRVVIPAVALFFALLGGFTHKFRIEASATRTNEGIWRTGENALRLGLATAVIYGLFITGIFGLNTGGGWASFRASFPFGAIAGLLMGTLTGLAGAEGSGVVWIQHWVLRLLLSWQKRIPWNYAQFLEDCTERILLKKVGGSYIFVHRLLQEHFANWRPHP